MQKPDDAIVILNLNSKSHVKTYLIEIMALRAQTYKEKIASVSACISILQYLAKHNLLYKTKIYFFVSPN